MKSKILFLGHLPPPIHGVSLINQWILKSQIINEQYDLIPVNLSTAKTIQNIGGHSPIKYLKVFRIAALCCRKLLLHRFSLAYMTLSPKGGAFLKDSLIVLLVRVFRVPLLLHLHGKGIEKALSSRGMALTKYYNFVFKKCHVIHLSDLLTPDIKRITSINKIHVIGNGIPCKYPPRVQQEATNQVVILYLSNFVPSKGAMTLLESVAALQNEGISGFKTRFVGAWGDERLKMQFEEYVREKNLQHLVEVPGPAYGEKKDEVLYTSDMFVLPTYYANECFPLTILEAMQAGLPVVSTYEGAIPEIVDDGKTGFLFPAKDVSALAGILKELIANSSLRNRMGKAARLKFEQHYTFDTFEKKLVNTFSEII